MLYLLGSSCLGRDYPSTRLCGGRAGVKHSWRGRHQHPFLWPLADAHSLCYDDYYDGQLQLSHNTENQIQFKVKGQSANFPTRVKTSNQLDCLKLQVFVIGIVQLSCRMESFMQD